MRGIAFFLSRGAEGSGASLAGRAERRLGEMMAEQPRAKGTAGAGNPVGGVSKTPPSDVPTLAQQGIDKNLAKRAPHNLNRVGWVLDGSVARYPNPAGLSGPPLNDSTTRYAALAPGRFKNIWGPV